ncbi:MAG: 30S ribosome-binding factor RbfA [Planctomycetes bacterium]|nr:30S ribosome-binding factor RbfA [Planctomycetota bacterium]
MSRRIERIASVIRRTVADAILNRLNDPRIESLTSVTRVEVSADLSVARVHVSVLADESRRQLCLAALQRASGRLRSLVSRQLSVRHTPSLVFRLDDSLRTGFETVQTIERLMSEMDARASAAGASEGEADQNTASPQAGAPPSMPDERRAENGVGDSSQEVSET